MASHIKVTQDPQSYLIAAGSTPLGQTAQALRMAEGSYPPVLYVPRSDVDMGLLQRTARQSTCPHKGLCSYYSITTPEGLLENAVWSYEAPIAGMEAIAGYLAFYPDKVSVTAL
jgi:uncharacterized protein (DUF427 family)